MQLVIAEKPSVAMSIAAVIGADERKDGYMEGGGYLVGWCVGHLAELADASHYGDYKKWRWEDLPILPRSFETVVAPDKTEPFHTLKKLMHRKDVTGLICATDAGREGELIFRFVYELAGCEKPFRRLWISSMEEAAIRKGFADLKDGHEYDPLYQSALCRAKADWLIGINATRLFSVLYNHTLNVGRVQTPTLSLLVERDNAIQSFQKKKYYVVHIAGNGLEAVSPPYTEKDEAEKLRADCEGEAAACTCLIREEKTENPPKLFDLTSLQREANRLYGYTAKQTLDYTQALYEKKLCTYPRTDSQFLTDDMLPTLEHLVSGLFTTLSFAKGVDLSPEYGRVLNSKKVSDHHAIIPTAEAVKIDPASLPESERNILLLIGAKLLSAIAPPYRYEAVTASFSCGGSAFTAKGKTVRTEGFKELQRRFRASLKEQPEDSKKDTEKALPELCEGQTFSVTSKLTEHDTQPPKAYTEDTLLSAMERAGSEDITGDAERKGLGTPATRAAVLEKLVQAGFIERKKKLLLPTKDGKNLISILPDMLTSPKLTAEWENELTRIAKGEADPERFMQGIEALAGELVKNHASVPAGHKAMFAPAREEIGKCPRCGSPVYEGKKNFYCSNRDCAFSMWKNDRFFEGKKATLTAKTAAALLSKGRVSMKGLYSEKTGKTYDADVLLADTGEKYVNYKIELKPTKKSRPKK